MDKVITGAMLRKMVISGANYLEENKEYVNSLNVFPVPDGDTGTNMSLTMKSSVKELNMCTTNDMETICDAISKGALKGARGNSGVILSQIMKGFTSYFTNLKEILDIAFINNVTIKKCNASDTASGKCFGGITTYSAHAKNSNRRIL